MNVQRAIEFAASSHSGQFRDGDDPLPYVTHTIEVLLNLRYVGLVRDQEMLCAAVLHDLVESTPVESGAIRHEFGDRVGELVSELTRLEPSTAEIAGMKKSEIWKLRAETLLDEISKMSPDAQVIKLADRLANFQEALRTKKGSKLERYRWQTRRMLEIVPRSRNKGLWDAISRLVEGF